MQDKRKKNSMFKILRHLGNAHRDDPLNLRINVSSGITRYLLVPAV